MKQYIEKKWLIAQIKPNSYDVAIRNLERQGFKTFLPKMEITQRKENKFLVRNVYVFPGYMFVCFNPDIITWTKINSTYGVSKILTSSNKPAEISSDLILELKNRYEFNSNTLQNEKLQQGDVIKFHKGPFVDLFAKVESVDEKNRIWVLLETMGKYKRLKLHSFKKNQFNKIINNTFD